MDKEEKYTPEELAFIKELEDFGLEEIENVAVVLYHNEIFYRIYSKYTDLINRAESKIKERQNTLQKLRNKNNENKAVLDELLKKYPNMKQSQRKAIELQQEDIKYIDEVLCGQKPTICRNVKEKKQITIFSYNLYPSFAYCKSQKSARVYDIASIIQETALLDAEIQKLGSGDKELIADLQASIEHYLDKYVNSIKSFEKDCKKLEMDIKNKEKAITQDNDELYELGKDIYEKTNLINGLRNPLEKENKAKDQ